MKALVVLVTVWKARRNVGKEGKRIWIRFTQGGGRCYGGVIVLRRVRDDAEGWRRASATEALTNGVHGVINIARYQHHLPSDIVTIATSYLLR